MVVVVAAVVVVVVVVVVVTSEASTMQTNTRPRLKVTSTAGCQRRLMTRLMATMATASSKNCRKQMTGTVAAI